MTKKSMTILVVSLILSATVLGGVAYTKHKSKLATLTGSGPMATPIPAPLFSSKSLNSRQITLQDLKGKVVIIDFFATWCPPCAAEIPHFVFLSSKYADKVKVIGVSVDDSSDDVVPFIKEKRIIYPIVMSEGKLDKLYGGISSIPTTFILDQNLNIVEKIMGYRDIEYFENAIDKLLEKQR